MLKRCVFLLSTITYAAISDHETKVSTLCFLSNMGVSKKRGSPKWKVYTNRFKSKWMIWGYHYFWKHPYLISKILFRLAIGPSPIFSSLWCQGGFPGVPGCLAKETTGLGMGCLAVWEPWCHPSTKEGQQWHTDDGRTPAPPGMYIMGETTYQLVSRISEPSAVWRFIPTEFPTTHVIILVLYNSCLVGCISKWHPR